MNIRTTYRWLLAASAVISLLGIVACVTFASTARWVGHASIELRFEVVDETTGGPIANAIIHIRADAEGLCDDSTQSWWVIATDGNGQATQTANDCLCTGYHTMLVNTHSTQLPDWRFHATATGFSATNSEYLNVPKNANRVVHARPISRLSIPIRMQRLGP